MTRSRAGSSSATARTVACWSWASDRAAWRASRESTQASMRYRPSRLTPREGDLWVVSSSSRSSSSTLHKLQLISGRVLTSIPLPTDERPAPLHRCRGHAAEHAGARWRRAVGSIASPRRDARWRWSRGSLHPNARVSRQRLTVSAYAAYDRGILRVELTTARDDRGRTRAADESSRDCGGSAGTAGRSSRFRAATVDASASSSPARRRRPPRASAVDVLDGNVSLAGPTSAHAVGRRRLLSQASRNAGNDQSRSRSSR